MESELCSKEGNDERNTQNTAEETKETWEFLPRVSYVRIISENWDFIIRIDLSSS